MALLFVSSLIFVSLGACGGSTNAETAAAAGGTPAPDGARGYCCPARTGGCALSGGYREESPCPTNFDICDNMCEQQIVKDAHGCDALTYKIPQQTTTYAGTGSCSGAPFHGEPPRGGDAGSDGSDADGGSDASGG